MFARVAMYEHIDVENFEPVADWFKEHGEELQEILMRGTRSHNAVYEVMQSDGDLNVSV